MTCNEVRENLVAYLHGELNKNDVMALHRHLGGCEACVREELALSKTNRLLRRTQFTALPDDFDLGLRHKLERAGKPHPKKWNEFRRIVYAVAATIIIMLSMIIIMLSIQFLRYRMESVSQPTAALQSFPATQTVFNPPEQTSRMTASLKERFIAKYLRSSRATPMKLGRFE